MRTPPKPDNKTYQEYIMPTPPDDKKKLDLPEDALIPEQDVKPLADELDAILAEGPPLEDESADPVVDEEMIVEEMPEGDLDMTPHPNERKCSTTRRNNSKKLWANHPKNSRK